MECFFDPTSDFHAQNANHGVMRAISLASPTLPSRLSRIVSSRIDIANGISDGFFEQGLGLAVAIVREYVEPPARLEHERARCCTPTRDQRLNLCVAEPAHHDGRPRVTSRGFLALTEPTRLCIAIHQAGSRQCPPVRVARDRTGDDGVRGPTLSVAPPGRQNLASSGPVAVACKISCPHKQRGGLRRMAISPRSEIHAIESMILR
jgi:hypothetical protein